MKKITTIAFAVVLILMVLIVWIYVANNNKRENDNQINQPINNEEMTGLKKTILKEGTGVEAQKGMMVKVHYTGWLTDGTKFDSSLDRGETFEFALGAGQVIEGWDEGVVGMKEGEIRKLEIPAEMAYGERAVGIIPANSELVFEVEMIKAGN